MDNSTIVEGDLNILVFMIDRGREQKFCKDIENSIKNSLNLWNTHTHTHNTDLHSPIKRHPPQITENIKKKTDYEILAT